MLACDDLAAGMAGGTAVELCRDERSRAPRNAGVRVHLPPPRIGRLQPGGQASPLLPAISWRVGASLGPDDMTRAGTVARFAGHIEVGPGGPIGVSSDVVVLLYIGRMAIGALVVPG